MRRADALRLIGGLSRPSKMPCYSFSIPAEHCRVGSELSKIPGSVCFTCYARKGNYRFPCVENAMEKRFKILSRVLESGRNSKQWRAWVAAFSTALSESQYFRFHDSGDLQSLNHLRLYCDVARAVPDCVFWIPTRETRIVRKFPQSDIPQNLRVRVSAAMVDSAPSGFPLMSAVVTGRARVPSGTFFCPSSTQGNKCLDCRACWNSTVPIVAYLKH